MAINNPDITHAELLERLHYDPLTGVFTRLTKTNTKWCIGQIAGSLTHEGYICISLRVRDKKHWLFAHRLAWFYVHGVWPMKFIDHRDRVRDNNAIDNLREATRSQNQHNRSISVNNTSGVTGVGWDSRKQKWRAQIYLDNRGVDIGYYDTLEEATAARQAKASELHGEFSPTP
jgi:hypothetical protein